jgi:hypothetical protein
MDEIRQIVLDAKRKYDASSGTKKKVQKALDKFSAQFMYYGAVLDVLAQHHPEYVALAWGAVKFVFVVRGTLYLIRIKGEICGSILATLPGRSQSLGAAASAFESSRNNW